MLTGNYAINMDAKGRMAIPTRAREELVELCGGRLVVTAHTQDPCVLIYPEPRWQEVLPGIQALPSMNSAARRVQRLLIGHACPMEMDGNGRILVPPTLRSRANLDKKLMLAGVGDKLELWDEDTWTTLMQGTSDDEIPEQLETLDF
ncbi:division/cell wall cluster transcriptional repressor MraZ [Gilvimarinus chinensis]|uniref:division/cell wall cluster transcriptional repressor MraZ n=1 Tax=Gilvimarinus chinensis TaxID=396005 RepID=UPI0003705D9E|nr:division/cell wall cluster transcriptional repressor MraZ [Gilvimarinus chinensis]